VSEAPLILGVSGLRGIVGESLTPEVAARYAGAFGAWLRDERDGLFPRVVVARDGRRGGETFEHAVIAGLHGAGCEVAPIGAAMTPTVGACVDALHFDGALIVTASHNPQQWNGLKCLVNVMCDGASTCAPDAAEAKRIIDLFKSGEGPWVAPGETRTIRSVVDSLDHHLDVLDDALALVRHEDGLSGETLLREHWVAPSGRLVVDSVNACGSGIVRRFAARLGASLMQLAGNDSGIFPHPPEPTRENLSGAGGLLDAVPGLGADVGFAQDPDGDRLAIVDERGRYVGEEYTLVLAAEVLLQCAKEEGREPVLVTNLSTSRMIDDVAAAHGARVVRTPVGEANVVSAMMRLAQQGERVILGGEGNGGVIWPEVTCVRDSLSAMALTLALMARTGKSVSELVAQINALSGSAQGYAIEKRKTAIPSKEAAAPAVEAIARHWSGARVDLQDGVRIDLDDERAWLHVRASNTEPIMRLIAETPDSARTGALLGEAQRVIDAGG